MATFWYQNCRIYFDKYDLTTDHNMFGLNHTADMLDNTIFTDSWRGYQRGLLNCQITGGGFWQSDGTDAVDDVLYTNFASNNKIITICPTTGADGEIAYTTQGCSMQYGIGGRVGDMIPFSLGAYSNNDSIRGTVMKKGDITATGDGTAYELGAVSATQKLYMAMHVVTVSGTNPTLDVIIESDDAEGMLDATTRGTFTQATAATSQWLTPVSGAIADTWWRASYTIAGTNTPTFTAIIVIGIQ